jgi:hypothetical protein
MKNHAKPRFGGFRRASGVDVAKIAKKTYVCAGCGLHHFGDTIAGKWRAPIQCKSCGRMDFTIFDSLGEANRWAALLLKVRANLITDLSRQVRFDLMAHRADGAGVKVGVYIADYVYWRDGVRVIEDFKGAITDLAQWKLRHMAAQGMPVTLSSSS